MSLKHQIIQSQNPKRKKELNRFWERFGEKAYSLAYNNYEHLVSYILTGNPFSEQIKKAGPLRKLVVDSFDNCISHGKRNMLKISGCLLAAVPVYLFFFFCKSAVTTVVKEVGNSFSRYSSSLPEQAVDCATKNVCKNASKQLGCKSSQILKLKRCTNVARKASKTALKKSAATTFLITGVIISIRLTFNERSRKEFPVQQELLLGPLVQDSSDRPSFLCQA